MDVLPRERAGAGSALTNTARQVGVALGVAVLGSILAQSYRDQLRPALSALPAAARGTAGQSIAATQAVAQQLGATGHQPARTAPTRAFTHAMHITTMVGALIALAGALVVLRWMPGSRPSSAQPGAPEAERRETGRRARRRGRISAMREAEVLPAQDGEPRSPPQPGRPRSERAERAILDAALELFAESGLGGVCIEAVAARAGVGKATIYRRWPGKQDLLLDALATLKSPLPEPGGESVRDDLVAMLRMMCPTRPTRGGRRRYTLLLGEGEKYPKADGAVQGDRGRAAARG